MRLTQMLAVLNGEVSFSRYKRLSHYDPMLDQSFMEGKTSFDKSDLTPESTGQEDKT